MKVAREVMREARGAGPAAVRKGLLQVEYKTVTGWNDLGDDVRLT